MSQSQDPFSPSNYHHPQSVQSHPEATPETWEDDFGVDGYSEGAFDNLGEDAFYSDDAFWSQGDLQETVTVEKIQELYKKVEAKGLPNQEELLATLKEAETIVSDGDSTNDDLALEHYEDVEFSLEEADFASTEETPVDDSEKTDLPEEETIPQSKLNEVAGKIMQGTSRIGAKWVPQGYGGRLVRIKQDGKVYSSDSPEENQDILKILPEMAQAIGESDPEKRTQLWETVGDEMVRLDTENEKKGNVNDRFRLLANVLYGELGEDGLKEALKLAIIPKDVASMIAAGLKIQPGENSSKEDAHRIWGGPDWTHATFAEFFTKYAGLNNPPATV